MLQGWEETDMVDRGAWTVLPDGTCLWRLSILSQGTSSHILIFRCALIASCRQYVSHAYQVPHMHNRMPCSSR